MSLFACFKCNTIENTATSFWFSNTGTPLCSECDPEIGKWHGHFEKRDFVKAGYQLCPDDPYDGRIICPLPDGWDYCGHSKKALGK